ncbi:hypothetical protein A8E51_00060 [Burkholderia cenocepacia]|nr:hypothetical protein A8D82_05280 [Burkholderia cenocepacia]ONN76833.1 hypothetical protein A8D64_34335 [Burkholderia cenocepacia]ONN82287.1 hypothetical protein A8D63_27825 [Burkholderia cenocepacia]ONN89037.1 hypothetical protein A8D62_20125 [Burkholderia cenocepacia]ONO01359.1 hypothetical protein A8D70_35250 [Burkholderia cenocepacia]
MERSFTMYRLRMVADSATQARPGESPTIVMRGRPVRAMRSRPAMRPGTTQLHTMQCGAAR